MNILDAITPEPGSFYVMDRGYPDFARLYGIARYLAFFVTRAKSTMKDRRLYSRSVDKTTGLKFDQAIVLTGAATRKQYPDKLRKIRSIDQETSNDFVFLTNSFLLPALTIAILYKCRWQIELLLKWIKQHLRITSFYGPSENAVKTQIWIAISVYALIAIIKKKLHLDASPYTILQILSLALFEKVSLYQLLAESNHKITENARAVRYNQLTLFDV